MGINSKKSNLNNSDIISASEIGQYQYCAISWKLQRRGHRPDSSYLEIGIKKHITHGETIDYIKKIIQKSKILTLIGYLSLFFAIFIIILEVIF
ncbi:MAG: hypothetical protein LN408_01280 [Candidatus Thermoplasmatota archaeon]|jgi:hypothetical protein|nr:hypothetical protein [Candidatus Thermoplasmatota archaeon]MCK5300426.1 hypothetical protein [Thermoplasmatales archaeon]